MAMPKGRPKQPGSGRKAGTPNKVTRSMREAFAEAFEQRGGVPALLSFADRSPENERVFYQLASKLIPSEVTGANGAPLATGIVILPPVVEGKAD